MLLATRPGLLLAACTALALGAAACGGSVVKDDDDGGGGAGGSGSGATASASTSDTGSPSATTGQSGTTGPGGTTTTGTGGGACGSHDDCPGGLCQFSSGTCIAACGEDGTCGPGLLCDGCASSSCPKCADCRAGCVQAPPHSCDDHDDCSASETCVFSLGGCYPRCGPDVGCVDGFACDDCATSSCPGCRDCSPACLPEGPPPPGGCTDHGDCGDGLLCVFGGGYCSPPCEDDGDCGSKAYCDPCLTSSCPGCDDCRAACVYLP